MRQMHAAWSPSIFRFAQCGLEWSLSRKKWACPDACSNRVPLLKFRYSPRQVCNIRKDIDKMSLLDRMSTWRELQESSFEVGSALTMVELSHVHRRDGAPIPAWSASHQLQAVQFALRRTAMPHPPSRPFGRGVCEP